MISVMTIQVMRLESISNAEGKDLVIVRGRKKNVMLLLQLTFPPCKKHTTQQNNMLVSGR